MEIEAINLEKRYKNKVVLDNINFKISSGSVVGILGKNGAGKTTLNNLICGIASLTAGKLLIRGEDASRQYKNINYLTENIAIYPNLNAIDNLRQIYFINNMTPDIKRIHELLELVYITETKKPVKTYSLGMKRKLQFVMSVMIATKDIIILDEPTNGLDINGLLWLKEEIRKFKSMKKTVIISTHAIQDLDDLFTEYMIIHHGMIASHDVHSDLSPQRLIFSVTGSDISKVCPILDTLRINYSIRENEFTVNLNESNTQNNIFQSLSKNRITPTSFVVKKESILDIFQRYTN